MNPEEINREEIEKNLATKLGRQPTEAEIAEEIKRISGPISYKDKMSAKVEERKEEVNPVDRAMTVEVKRQNFIPPPRFF